MRAEMPVRSGRLPVSGLEYAELCREAESSQSLVSRVVRVTVSLAHCDTLTTVPRTSLAIHLYFFFFEYGFTFAFSGEFLSCLVSAAIAHRHSHTVSPFCFRRVSHIAECLEPGQRGASAGASGLWLPWISPLPAPDLQRPSLLYTAAGTAEH